MIFPLWEAAATGRRYLFDSSCRNSGHALATEQSMIMLMTSSPAGLKCSEVLQKGIGEQVQLVTHVPDALRWLRTREYSAIVLDQVLAEGDPVAVTSLLHHAGTAIPIYLNLAISGAERLLTEVKTGFRRRRAEQLSAVKAASSELRDELRGAVTGILLSSELALSVPALPLAAQAKIADVVDLAQRMRRRLEA
jgi:hypothetical protein